MAAAMLEEAAHITRLRFGDIVNVNGHDKDMKSESGLFVTFPLAFLMSGLR